MQQQFSDRAVLIKQLSLRYRRAKGMALKNISLSMKSGEILGLVGESGSGKSSLLRVLAGLERIAEGRIFLFGKEVSSAARHVPPQKRGVGMVFQDFALFPHLTVAQNVLYGLPSKADQKAVLKRSLEQVGLETFTDKYPFELSGGEQQRLALARALAPEPKLLLLDEPFSNLDEALKESVRQQSFDILKAAGITAILVTHDMRDVLLLSDRVAVLKAGELQQLESLEQIYHRPANEYVAGIFGKINIVKPSEMAAGLVQPAHTTGLMGIRPDNLLVQFEPGAGLQKTTLLGCLYLGAGYELKLKFNNTVLIANVEDVPAPLPELAYFRIKNPDRICFF